MKARELILAALFAALTAVGAFIKIQIPYVPITMQFFFCALSGIMLGSRIGAISQILYVAIGLFGFPVFTQGGGIGYVFKPTFGYLLGFIACAYVIGFLTERLKRKNTAMLFICILSGWVTMYVFGLSYMYMLFNYYLNSDKSVWWILKIGLLPFVAGDMIHCVIISLVSVRLKVIIKGLLTAGR